MEIHKLIISASALANLRVRPTDYDPTVAVCGITDVVATVLERAVASTFYKAFKPMYLMNLVRSQDTNLLIDTKQRVFEVINKREIKGKINL